MTKLPSVGAGKQKNPDKTTKDKTQSAINRTPPDDGTQVLESPGDQRPADDNAADPEPNPVELLATKNELEFDELKGLKVKQLRELAILRDVDLVVNRKDEIINSLLAEVLDKPINYLELNQRGFKGVVSLKIPVSVDMEFTREREQINLRQMEPAEKFAFLAMKKAIENSPDRPNVVTGTHVFRFLLQQVAAHIVDEMAVEAGE